MTDQQARKRAAGMSTEDRRAMIVQATIPLLVEFGPSVTTLRIARAAGISEPTIFRAFADKNEVLAACLAEVTDPRHVVAELASIERDLPLSDRVTALIEGIRAQGERTGAVVNAIQLAGPRIPPGLPLGERDRLAERRTDSYTRLHDAVADVFEPDADALRMPVAEVATLVLAVVLSLARNGSWDTGPASVDTAKLVDLIVHGIAA